MRGTLLIMRWVNEKRMETAQAWREIRPSLLSSAISTSNIWRKTVTTNLGKLTQCPSVIFDEV